MTSHTAQPLWLWYWKKAPGFSLIEVIVALGILSFIILGFSMVTVSVYRYRDLSEKWVAAINLAQDKMEELKTRGKNLSSGEDPQRLFPFGRAGGIFRRRWVVSDSGLQEGLIRIDVTVSWRDFSEHTLTVATLLRP